MSYIVISTSVSAIAEVNSVSVFHLNNSKKSLTRLFYTVLQIYAHIWIGLKQNLLRSTTLDIIIRLRDNAAFVCVQVLGRFCKDFSEVRGLREVEDFNFRLNGILALVSFWPLLIIELVPRSVPACLIIR